MSNRSDRVSLQVTIAPAQPPAGDREQLPNNLRAVSSSNGPLVSPGASSPVPIIAPGLFREWFAGFNFPLRQFSAAMRQ
jgi:hypothetical protein